MVPLNYSSGRLFCKFSILLLSIFLLFWIFLEKQQLSVKTEDLQVQLRFANEHISSLSAQINVISKHKDRIEALFAKEKERCNESINQQSKRISLLQIENVRLNDLMENIRQQKLLEKQSSLNNTSFLLPKIDSPPLETKNNLVEDPFDKKEEEENIPAIPAQIKKPPNINNLEENQLKLNNKKSSLSRITKKEQQPNGGEKHFEEDYNIFRRKNKLREDLEEEKEEEEYVGKE
uniref:Uncharacterized protein n=1 Tax=Meloidogyne javanica TaxID=6303 RepID=A0A915MLW5_MELJA